MSTAVAPRRRSNTLAAYTGADLARSALKEWRATLGSADSDTLPDLPTLRAFSRDLIRNEPLAGGAIETKVEHAVGTTGLRLQCQIDWDVLGLTQDEASAWQRRTEFLFGIVSNRLDIERRKGWLALQDLAMRSPLESGDLFVLRRRKLNPGDVLGLKVQLVEADRVCNPQMRMNTDRLRDGVELDADGAPVRYWVADRHPGDFLSYGPTHWSAMPAFGPVSGERMTLHLYREKRPGQTRGVPDLAPVIEKFKQLGRLTDAEIMAAVINALFTVFVKTKTGEDGLAEVASAAGVMDDGDAAPTDDLKLGSGMVADLAEGEDLVFADPKRPNPALEAFIAAIMKQIGVGLGLPYEVLMKHFASSYSAARAALLQAWRHFLRLRNWLAADFCQPIYEWFLAESVAAGLIRAPGFFTDPIARAAWCTAAWNGDSPGQLDPVRETRAAVERIDAGLSSLKDEAAALGRDWEAVHEQRVREVTARRAAGLDDPAPDPAGTQAMIDQTEEK